ncbi:DUF4328 domain-containing protein [Ammonicoccus fulvus]|uniref:DUF4328 domain-containing protein n=1 Tax=Ammonicoccus fulvus TaxID=3138240 RepID=A0ABZ3FRB2_9ACTN
MSQPPRPDSWQQPSGWQQQTWPDQGQPAPGQQSPQNYGGYPGAQPPTNTYQPPTGTYQPPTGTYQPTGAPPGWTQPQAAQQQFRPVHTLGIWAVALAAIYASIFTIASLFSPAAAAEYRWALDVGRLDETFTLYDTVAAVAALFLLPAAILGVVWLWRARHNTLVFDPQARHQRGSVWVIIGWIVPIVAFWFPYQVVRDVVRNSVRKPLGPVLGLWWASWLVAMILGNLADQQVDTVFSEPTDAGLTALPFLAIVAAIATIVAAVFWARIILAVSRAQHARAAQSSRAAAW